MAFLDNSGLKHLISKIKTYIASATVKKADTANKLATPRTIIARGNADGTPVSFDGSSNISLPINKFYNTGLEWSDKGGDTAGRVTPLGAALVSDLNSNRIAFAPNDCIVAEYSNDGGATWKDCTNSGKSASLTTTYSANYTIGNKATTGSNKATVDDKLRITIIAKTGSIYAYVRKIFIWLTTNGATGCKVLIEKSTIGDPDTFTEVKTSTVSGWSGWNEINTYVIFGGSNSQSIQTRKLRFTFSISGVNATYNSILNVNGMYFMGESCFAAPSNLAKSGHMYKIGYTDKSCEFPANVSIQKSGNSYNGKFIGDLQGTADAATVAYSSSKATCDSSGNNIEETYVKKTDTIDDLLILNGGDSEGYKRTATDPVD